MLHLENNIGFWLLDYKCWLSEGCHMFAMHMDASKLIRTSSCQVCRHEHCEGTASGLRRVSLYFTTSVSGGLPEAWLQLSEAVAGLA